MRIGVFGAGAIGCYLGGCLIDSGVSVVLVGRERVKSVVVTHGILVTDWKGRNAQIAPELIDFSVSPEDLQGCDIVMVTVKSGDTGAVAKEIARWVKPGALVVSFQNGIYNGEVLKQELSSMTVLTGMVPFNVINSGEGHFHCGTEGRLALEGAHGKEQSLVQVLVQAGLPVNVYIDMKAVQWGKLVMNLNNSINALSGVPLLQQLEQRDYRVVLANSIKEALSTLKVAGIKPARTGKVIPQLLPFILSLPNGLFKKVANAMLKIDPKAVSSMAQDLQLGRKTEIDYLNGEIVKLAKEKQTVAPINERIVKLIKSSEDKGKGSPCISASQLRMKIMG